MEVVLQFDFCFTAEGTDEDPEVRKLTDTAAALTIVTSEHAAHSSNSHHTAFCARFSISDSFQSASIGPGDLVPRHRQRHVLQVCMHQSLASQCTVGCLSSVVPTSPL